MSSAPPPAARRPRADAERNRLRILEAARTLFTERGDDVQMPEVARAADVGVGTVYRHFPTRQALVEAAAEHRFAQIRQFAEDRRTDPARPGQAVADYLHHVGEALESDRGLSAAIEAARGSAGSEPRDRARAELLAAVGKLIDLDRSVGALREDFTVADVYMITGAVSATIRTGSGDWRRLVALVLDGMRAR